MFSRKGEATGVVDRNFHDAFVFHHGHEQISVLKFIPCHASTPSTPEETSRESLSELYIEGRYFVVDSGKGEVDFTGFSINEEDRE